MNQPWGAFLGGGFLTLLGAVLMWSHRRNRARRLAADEPEDEFEFRHYHRRYRRRMQTSFLILLVGLMVLWGPVVLPDPKNAPRLFAVWWLTALGLTLWMVLLAVGDIVATRTHSSVALTRLRIRQKELEHKLSDIQKRQSNGRHEE